MSVYNLLSLSRRDLTLAEVVTGLQQHWSPEVDEAWVAEGVSFLAERGLVVPTEGALVPGRPRAPDGTCWPLRRAANDTELRWAV